MTMMQAFEWYVPADHKHWARLEKQIPQLKRWGVDNLWIPPGCKGSSTEGNGYDIYDLYDLGEFDQKGGVATKWGNKEELVQMTETANQHGVGLYWDAVLNHRFAADRKEKCMAHEVDQEDRTQQVSDVYEIHAWVGYDFPARQGKYSQMQYHWYHFSGVDYNAANEKSAIYKIMGDKTKDWADAGDVDGEKGNYDYLMGSDLDYDHEEVAEDVLNWGKWLASQVTLKGFRFDAIKHFSEDFLRRFITNMDETYGQGWFCVGEFWKDSLQDMEHYLDRMGRKFCLFDAPLVYNFSEISQGDSADMRKVFDDTLVQAAPMCAVTLVMNHDTQPYQALEAPIADWFKPLAYSLILLRDSGYPCIFYGDLYGIKGENPFPPSCGGILPRIILARKLYAYGQQAEYFDEPTCLGIVRYGTWDRRFGCAAVLSNAGAASKRMHVGEMHAGERWTDVLGWNDREVEIGEDGFGDFPCGQCSVSIYVNKDAEGREKFSEEFDSNIYEE
ncbi:family 13 glycoside hydrolase [Cryphonectria parasitica EP155]|uniref:Family 13 glycoside hydrolase n=1 Tax=Cryphonectria parasitica (strain ATCC 38755 / EP155) TaxID=660469 RepID=A0A9P5CNR2_CRYP1|nr:family 13 glycoside hydrolase [Cryphonectria parasitica EP155]KAF3765408.1 family 13 glycoside hydrolase [Cryphonectria parasitica EP155]